MKKFLGMIVFSAATANPVVGTIVESRAAFSASPRCEYRFKQTNGFVTGIGVYYLQLCGDRTIGMKNKHRGDRLSGRFILMANSKILIGYPIVFDERHISIEIDNEFTKESRLLFWGDAVLPLNQEMTLDGWVGVDQ